MFSFWVMTVGVFVWTLGCYACCALVVTAPVGALIVGRSASGRGVGGGARIAAWYWATGLVPWICYRHLLNGGPVPARLVNLAYRAMLVLWFLGPVVGGGMLANNAGGPNSEWMLLIPGVNLVMLALAVGWRSVAERTGSADVRLGGGDAVPFVFGTMGMLSLLPQAFLMPLILSLL